MDQRLELLARKFQDQERFAVNYSPLYAHLFGLIGGWLAHPSARRDPLVEWLLTAGRDRRPLDVTLLLAAGLHYDVLSGHPAAEKLAKYYPTAGGERSFTDNAFPGILRETILARREKLANRIKENTVQTNETGRGLCWLLPVLTTGWSKLHLIDLGASAGLNLVAERRAYALESLSEGRQILNLGLGTPDQFQTRCQGKLAALSAFKIQRYPVILSRIGNDLAPFDLATREDEWTLMSFIWGDQVNRLDRLKEGIAVFHQVQKTAAPVQLFPASLPDDLPEFLQDHTHEETESPVVIYNTWMTTYLEDKGSSFPGQIGRWADLQSKPVLWLQWEPAIDSSRSSEYGWCAWTADLWYQGKHRRWQLGWVHPHGGEVEFGEGLDRWLGFWS